MSRSLPLALAAVVGVCVPIGSPRTAFPENGNTDDGYAWVVFGTDSVRAEVAASEEERQRGLMFRDDVPEGTGMLFLFPRAGIQSIWMKNTFVPLDVAFLDPGYRVLNIVPLEPEDLAIKSSEGYALLALEVRRGWFAEHGVEAGDRATITYASPATSAWSR